MGERSEDGGRPAFGALLRRFRLEARLSQEALAERARMSVKTVSALESGARRAPYRETISMLSEALGLEPEHRALLASAASRPSQPRLHLVESATTGAVALDVKLRPQTAVAADATRAPRHNLPEELSSLIGREDLVAEIGALVGQHRLVTLVGSGGIGKTRVACRAARNALGDWPDGVWLAELAPVRDQSLVASAVSQVFHVPAASERSPLELLVDSLKNRRVLLVLDNCEHVIDEVSNIAVTVLRDCPAVSILATSREPLNVTGEWVSRVPSLSAPESTPASVHEASSYAAVALFADRSQAAAGLELDDGNVAAVSEICRRLDGIPLAIELAAARMKVLTPSQAAQMLDERFRILSGGDRTAMPRQQTMRSALDWSYTLLSEQERLLFDRLSVFVGGFTLEAVGTVCAAAGIEELQVLDLLSSLVDKSLVIEDRAGEQTRFRLLESSREYASEKLAERGERDLIADRHVQFYLKLAERLSDFVAGGSPHDRKRLMEVRSEQGNWSAALTWSLRDGHDIALGQRLTAVATRPGYLSRDKMDWLREALNTCDERTPPELVASLEYNRAYCLLDSWELEASLEGSRRAIDIFRELAMPQRVANTEYVAALSLAHLGRAVEATELIQQVVASARNRGSNDELRKCLLRALQIHYICRGDVNSARSTYTEVVQLSEGSCNEPADFLAYLNICMASCEAESGDIHAAVRLGAAAVAVFRELRHPQFANSLNEMTGILIASERYDAAREHALEAIAMSGEVPEAWLLETLHHLSAIAALRQRSGPSLLRADRVRGARLLGYVTARLAAIGKGHIHWVRDRQERDETLAVLHETLADELTQLMAGGAAMSEDRAVELARSI